MEVGLVLRNEGGGEGRRKNNGITDEHKISPHPYHTITSLIGHAERQGRRRRRRWDKRQALANPNTVEHTMLLLITVVRRASPCQP